MGENPLARPPRVLVPELAAHRAAPEEDEILLGREEKDHVRSRRLRDGDEVVVLDGKGLRARGTLTRSGTAVALFRSEILLGREEKDHVRSRRLRDGDEVVVLDGKGLRARGTLTRSGTAVALF